MIPYARAWIDRTDEAAVVQAMRSGWLTQGPTIAKFEEALCEYTGCKHAVAVSSGTAALHCATQALGLRRVTTSPNTFVATENALLLGGVRDIKFADISLDTGMAEGVTVPVEFAGRACNGGVLIDSCHSFNSNMRFDNCEARAVSFHYLKNITTLGEGGAVLTDSYEIAEHCRAFRDHGRPLGLAGLNYRMPETHAAMGLTQLKKARRFKEDKDQRVCRYNLLLGGIVETPPYEPEVFWHVYVIRSPARERIENALGMADIQTRRLYPPLAPLPNAVAWYETALAIPLFAELTYAQQDKIVNIIREAV